MNPYKIEGPAAIGFSGGRSSAYMLKQIIDAHGGELPNDIHVGFQNTGKERPETLDFIHECSTRWGVKVEWLEYDRTWGQPEEQPSFLERPSRRCSAATARRGCITSFRAQPCC